MTVLSIDAEYLLQTYFRVSSIIYFKETQHADGSWTFLVVIRHHNDTEYIYTLFRYAGVHEQPERDDYEQTRQIHACDLYTFSCLSEKMLDSLNKN